MKVSEAFLVNTKNFDPIIKTLANYDAEEIVINSNLMEHLTYSDPNDLLVLRILKDFSIINNDGRPGELFNEFQHPETTKKALAKGLISAYEGIFDKYPDIHGLPLEKIKEAFEEHFDGKKTDLIIKYISGTFKKVVDFVGNSTIDDVLNPEPQNVTASLAANADEYSNGNTNGTKQQSFSAKKEISAHNIDDLLNDFEESDAISDSSDSTKNKDQADASEDPSVQEFIPKQTTEDVEHNGHDNPKSQKLSSESSEISDTDEEYFPELDDNEPSIPNTKETNPLNTNSNITDIDPIDLEIPLSDVSAVHSSRSKSTTQNNFIHKAFVRKADILYKLKRWEELVPALEEIISRYDNQEESSFKDTVDQAIVRRATSLLKLGDFDKALPALSVVINRFKNAKNQEFYNQASRAMLYKADILEKKNADANQLLQLYNDIIDRMDTSSQEILNQKLDSIHCKRFDLLVDIDQLESTELLKASIKLIERFKEGGEYQDYLQKAMIIRAETLDEMGEDEAALKAYDEFLNKFGN